MSNAFQTMINEDKPTLVDFYAEWCGPCKYMKPILEDLKSKIGDQAKIVKVDVDRNTQIAQSLRIQGVPTLILFRNGKIMWRQSGVVSSAELQKVIQLHLN